jgi:Secretion system C-terminal sorting domain
MKSFKFVFVLSLAIGIHLDANSQSWIFGDSCRIDFVNGVEVVGTSNCSGEISSVLHTPNNLFYAYSNNKIFSSFNYGRVFNDAGTLISTPTGLRSFGRFHTILMVPFPGDSTKAYIFHEGSLSSQLTLYYSVLNLYGNFGVGSMISTNNTLLQDDISGGSVNIVRHGNGRDWWLFVRQTNSLTSTPTNLWYRFLIDPLGIHGPYLQNIGQTSYGNIDALIINSQGTRSIYLTAQGLLDLYEIDRCSGLFINYQMIAPKLSINPPLPPSINFTQSGEFSYSGQYFYATAFYNNVQNNSFLLQFDLLDTNILLSRKIIHTFPPMIDSSYFYPYELRRAPNNKIFLASFSGTYSVPYCDTCAFDSVSMYLGVINSPDSNGILCDFAPFSFYLGGNRTYSCLPKMPNYNIGVAVGSGCDTLVATGMGYEFIEEKNRIHCWPNPASSTVNIRWGGVEKVKNISIVSNTGAIVFSKLWQSEFDVMEIPIQFLTSGLYVVELQLTSGEKFRKKLMVMNE